jgi:flagellar FliL protein
LSKHIPAIQHTVMMVLSEQTIKDINTVAGKQKLRDATLKEVQALLQSQIGDPGVEEIYFTGFIIQ